MNESKALNDLRGPFVVISASGMCEAGRILHHLKNNIENPRNTILITGYQAEHTLGRKIVEKQREVPIFGDPMRLRAEVVKLNELSGHADQRELLTWLRPAEGPEKRSSWSMVNLSRSKLWRWPSRTCMEFPWQSRRAETASSCERTHFGAPWRILYLSRQKQLRSGWRRRDWLVR